MEKCPKWRILRTVIQSQLTPVKSDSFRRRQEVQADKLVAAILESRTIPSQFFQHVRRFTLGVMVQVTYGKELQGHNDVEEIYNILQDFSEITMSQPFLADLFPPLASIPEYLQWWRPRALATRARQSKVWLRYWEDLKAETNTETTGRCLAGDWLRHFSHNPGAELIDEQQWAFFAGTMLEAGSESTASVLLACLAHLAVARDVQEKARAELTTACGPDPPTFSVKPSCPYIRAIIQETLRLVPSTNNGIAHYTNEDTEYNGMVIPKNTVVAINTLALYHSASRYDEPLEFHPERYLRQENDLQTNLKPEVADADHIKPHGAERYIWGAGRRICPGMYLAENTLFVALAKILWEFDITPPLHDDGAKKLVELQDEAFESGRIVIPRPFNLVFMPIARSMAEGGGTALPSLEKSRISV
ncbi:MAG: hypothetical protein MMC23_007951 [Stictis urceolatum]|nr:hypothetical protein [Stictis urceolata]